MLSFGFEPIIRFWPPALLAISPVGITRQFPDPDDRNRTSSEILGYEMASLSPPSWNGEFRLQANPQISASGLVGYVAPARITRQFQITAPHQKSYGFEPMHGPCWSSVVLRLRKSWIWLSEMASLSAVDLPVGSEVKGQCALDLKQSSCCLGQLVLLLPQHLSQRRADARKGEVVVEETDEDEGDGTLRQSIGHLKEPNRVEGHPNWSACNEEDRLDNLTKDEENQQRTESLEKATHHTDEDRLVMENHEGDADLKNHGVPLAGIYHSCHSCILRYHIGFLNCLEWFNGWLRHIGSLLIHKSHVVGAQHTEGPHHRSIEGLGHCFESHRRPQRLSCK